MLALSALLRPPSSLRPLFEDGLAFGIIVVVVEDERDEDGDADADREEEDEEEEDEEEEEDDDDDDCGPDEEVDEDDADRDPDETEVEEVVVKAFEDTACKSLWPVPPEGGQRRGTARTPRIVDEATRSNSLVLGLAEDKEEEEDDVEI
ncbi:MAG: hypothetical protein M1816_000997 [Peltula sp. TS41687]|nr:MAG: hypothetical protein M1816_000997 [Peltula sp. TS41687]